MSLGLKLSLLMQQNFSRFWHTRWKRSKPVFCAWQEYYDYIVLPFGVQNLMWQVSKSKLDNDNGLSLQLRNYLHIL